MQRRNVILGIGALATGSALAISGSVDGIGQTTESTESPVTSGLEITDSTARSPNPGTVHITVTVANRRSDQESSTVVAEAYPLNTCSCKFSPQSKDITVDSKTANSYDFYFNLPVSQPEEEFRYRWDIRLDK